MRRRERESEKERERVIRREREREREKVGEREREYLFLKGMTGALAPFSYLVKNIVLGFVAVLWSLLLFWKLIME